MVAHAYEVVPLDASEAWALLKELHPRGRVNAAKFSVGVRRDGEGPILGVLTAGKPTVGSLDDGRTLEVLRVCARPGEEVVEPLLWTAREAARGLGYRKLLHYTVGYSMDGLLGRLGWRPLAIVRGRVRRRGPSGRIHSVAPFAAEQFPPRGLDGAAPPHVDRTRWELVL